MFLAGALLLAACGGAGPSAGINAPVSPTSKPGGVAPPLSSTLIAGSGTAPYQPSLLVTPDKPAVGAPITMIQPPGKSTPAPAGIIVSFSKDVLPILKQQCASCHVDQSLGGLSLKDYDSWMKGGQGGPLVIRTSPDTSLLVRKLRGDPAVGQPRSEHRLPEDSLRKISDWIRQGALNN